MDLQRETIAKALKSLGHDFNPKNEKDRKIIDKFAKALWEAIEKPTGVDIKKTTYESLLRSKLNR